METAREIARAAELLRNNPFLPTVLAQVEADIIQRWRAATDPREREFFWHQLKGMDYLAGAIERECRNAIERYERAGDG
jgi:hypothetical protein